MNRRVSLPDEAATAALAADVATASQVGQVIALSGDLGAGKTAFARAFIRALCGAETEVPSPTFTLLQTYASPRGPIYHYDLYRLAAPDEIFALEWEQARQGIILLEWPLRLGTLLPRPRLAITLSYGTTEGARTASLETIE